MKNAPTFKKVNGEKTLIMPDKSFVTLADSGWNLMNCTTKDGRGFTPWLGYTITESLRTIDKLF